MEEVEEAGLSATDVCTTPVTASGGSQSDALAALTATVARQASELEALRSRLDRVVQLAEQFNTDVAALRQEWLQHQQQQQKAAGVGSSGTRSRKRKRLSRAETGLEPRPLFDQPFSAEQAEQHLSRCFTNWRLEEASDTSGWACIYAVLTLLNHRLQRAHDRHVRFVTSYPSMEAHHSDVPVHDQCMGVDLTAVQYVVAPVTAEGGQWALIVWDSDQRQLLLLDLLARVREEQGARLQRLQMRRAGAAKKAVRLPVPAQQDGSARGLLVLLCCACYIASSQGDTWHSTISGVHFTINSMREWLERLKAPNAHVSFTLKELPLVTVAHATEGASERKRDERKEQEVEGKEGMAME